MNILFECPKYKVQGVQPGCFTCKYSPSFRLEHIFKDSYHIEKLRSSIKSRRQWSSTGKGYLMLTTCDGRNNRWFERSIG